MLPTSHLTFSSNAASLHRILGAGKCYFSIDRQIAIFRVSEFISQLLGTTNILWFDSVGETRRNTLSSAALAKCRCTQVSNDVGVMTKCGVTPVNLKRYMYQFRVTTVHCFFFVFYYQLKKIWIHWQHTTSISYARSLRRINFDLRVRHSARWPLRWKRQCSSCCINDCNAGIIYLIVHFRCHTHWRLFHTQYTTAAFNEDGEMINCQHEIHNSVLFEET